MGDKRNYSTDQVKALQGSVKVESTLAKIGAKQLRKLFETEPYVNTFGAYIKSGSLSLCRINSLKAGT